MRLGGSNNRSRRGAQMLPRLAFACVTAIAMASSLGFAQAPSPNGVKTLNPPGAIKTEGTWSLGARAGDFVFVAGMQGVDPATNTLVQDPYARIERGRHAKHALCCCHLLSCSRRDISQLSSLFTLCEGVVCCEEPRGR